MIPAIFKGMCPEGDLKTHDRSQCIEEEILRIKSDLKDYEKFFKACLGSPPWEIQKMWAKRALAGWSFAAVAPTGVGKTVFGLVTSYYFAARRGNRSYLIFPTSLLVDQALETLRNYERSVGKPLSVLAYRSGMRSKEKKKFYEELEEGYFDILLTTSQYLARNHEKLRNSVSNFHFIFVDDVDSFLKSSKNVDRVLTLMGFSEGDIEAALKGNEVEKRVNSLLIVSTATGRPGPRVFLFRRLLGFDVGILRQEMLRNIVDLYTREESDIANFMKSMGSGFLIFVPKMEIAEKARALAEKAGFKVEILRGYNESLIESFKSGELDGLIGAARPYSVLVRGLDLPHRVRYVIFYGVPRFEISLKEIDEMSDRTVVTVLSALAKGLDQQIKRFAMRLRRQASKEDLSKARELLKEIVSSEEEIKELSDIGDISIEAGDLKIVIPDIRTYIQGSGRSSRLYPGGMTRGASLVWDEAPLLTSFIKRASAYDIDLARIGEVDLEELREEIDESRRKYASLRTGLGLIDLKTALFIVESPNKARTIAKFFGKPGRRIINGNVAYEVTTGNYVLIIMASGGHVVDLSTQGGYHGVLIEGEGGRTYIPIYASLKRCLDCGYQFTDGDRCPRCRSANIRDSGDNVVSMRRLGFETAKVIIGTDPDTEGEKIAWDIYQLIKDAAEEVYRAEFHEITKRAILEALQQLGETNERRVKAQIVRRIEDRWIGFELSHEVQRRFNRKNLSAGRAQTPTLGWIIERYEQHKRKKYVTVIRGQGISMRLEGKVGSPGIMKARVISMGLREEVIKPPPPFTTDEMIREANRILRLGAKRAMDLAQSLFEAGLITYHRTDSVRVSDAGLRVAAEVLGDEFVARRWGEGGAHECIRPTKPLSTRELLDYIREGLISPPEGFSKDHLRLYDLIFRRFIASQAKESVIVKQSFKLILDKEEVEGERILEIKGGWALMYPSYKRSPPIEGTVEVEIRHLRIPSAPLLTQGDVVALMREKGIGRPSTYATIIDKLLQRRYVVERYNRLIPTKLGIEVYDFLTAEYPDLISEERTHILEEKMTSVEEGRLDYQELIDELYREIQEKVVRRRA